MALAHPAVFGGRHVPVLPEHPVEGGDGLESRPLPRPGDRQRAVSRQLPAHGHAPAHIKIFCICSVLRTEQLPRVVPVPPAFPQFAIGFCRRFRSAQATRGCRPFSAENSPPDCFPGAPNPTGAPLNSVPRSVHAAAADYDQGCAPLIIPSPCSFQPLHPIALRVASPSAE